MRRHSVRPQPIQKPDLVDEKVDVDGCADAGEEGNDEEGQRAGVAEEAREPEDVDVEESDGGTDRDKKGTGVSIKRNSITECDFERDYVP